MDGLEFTSGLLLVSVGSQLHGEVSPARALGDAQWCGLLMKLFCQSDSLCVSCFGRFCSRRRCLGPSAHPVGLRVTSRCSAKLRWPTSWHSERRLGCTSFTVLTTCLRLHFQTIVRFRFGLWCASGRLDAVQRACHRCCGPRCAPLLRMPLRQSRVLLLSVLCDCSWQLSAERAFPRLMARPGTSSLPVPRSDCARWLCGVVASIEMQTLVAEPHHAALLRALRALYGLRCMCRCIVRLHIGH
jgi:hypothetical protein